MPAGPGGRRCPHRPSRRPSRAGQPCSSSCPLGARLRPHRSEIVTAAEPFRPQGSAWPPSSDSRSLPSPDPHRRVSWLDGPVDDLQQLRPNRLQVDCVPKARREGGHGRLRVVASAVEATIHDPLDTDSQRVEERNGRQGRGGATGDENPSALFVKVTTPTYTPTTRPVTTAY